MRVLGKLGIAGVVLVACSLTRPVMAPPDGEPREARSPREVAEAYFEAIQRSDLDGAGSLFLPRSLVFEAGGVEGSWETYRGHHLQPEIDEIASFAITMGEPREEISGDRSMAFVAWPIEYVIKLADGTVVKRTATTTFVFGRQDGSYRIRHLHWSSRAPRPAP